MKAKILGIKYRILTIPPDEPILIGSDGLCDFYGKTIYVSDLSDWSDAVSDSSKLKYRKQIIRHEILHAALYESGLAFNTDESDQWATNEEMVDWIAIQAPKLMKVYKKLGVI